jgi:hypothetical protein
VTRTPVKVLLTPAQAQAVHWFIRHMSFEDALKSTPPHLDLATRKERAYDIIHATSAVQAAIEDAEVFGDSWMYST